MTLPVTIDTTEKGLDRVLSQWSKSPKVLGLFQSFLENVQPLEDTLFQLLNDRGVRRAEGVNLDILGAMVGEIRFGRVDATYRIAILTRALLNQSNGTPPEVLEFLSRLTGTDNVNLWEHFPADIHTYASDGVNTFIANALKDAAPAGVNVRLMFDIDADSFVPPEFEESILEIDNLDTVEVVDSTGTLYDLAVNAGQTQGSLHGFLPELHELIEATQQVVNPEFIADTDWTKGTGWTISGGNASKTSGTASSLEQSITVVEDIIYVISYKITGYSAGTLTPQFQGGSTSLGTSISADGTYQERITANTGNTDLHFVGDSAFVGNVDEISVFDLNEVPVNPLCDIIDSSTAIISIVQIIDESGNLLVDENANRIIAV